ncbi:MAG: hypothetical protein QM734_11890 [Cyclobacteriaceae bacterium]
MANGWDGGDDHGLFNMSASISSSGANPSEPAWNPRPAFYYLYFLQKYLGDRLVTTSVSPASSDLTAYSSSFTSGESGVVIVNKGTTAHTALVNINHFKPGTKYYWYTLTPGTDNGEFSGEVIINGSGPSQSTVGGPVNAFTILYPYTTTISSGSFKIYVPARSTLYVVVENKK